MEEGNLHHLRQTYNRHRLDDKEVADNPIVQFQRWFEEATNIEGIEPNAMMLGTIDEEGRLSSRVVLLKSFDEAGFIFYTNYNSRKAKAIAYHNQVSLTFFWEALERQVHIQGKAYKVPAEVSDQYFHERPYGHQIGAWVSPQSSIIPDRAYLEDRVKQFEQEFTPESIERPPHWGGYRVEIDRIEFWQGRPNRLHDRIEYRLDDQGRWENQRLAP